MSNQRGASSALASVLSMLLPGLGQIYQERVARGAVIFGALVIAVAVATTLLLTIDAVTAFALRNTKGLAATIAGILFVYHAWSVIDAFAAGRPARARRAALQYAVLALVLLLLAGGYATLYARSAAWGSVAAAVFEPIARPPAPGDGAQAPAWNGTERLNVLLLGVDKRDEAPGETNNTDSLIVMSLDPLNKTAAMLSVPRDVYTTIPGHGSDKINAAYSLGGADLTRRSVEQLLGIRIHSYALIDFASFTRIIDTVGGVFVDVEEPVRDEEYPVGFGVTRVNIGAGPQVMGGELALRYARTRHDSNDFMRARRQQEVLNGLRARLQQQNFLARLPAIVDKVGAAVKTTFDPGDVLPVLRVGAGIDRSQIRNEVLLPCPAEPRCELKEQNDWDGYYLFPEKARIAALVAELFYDPRVRQEAARVEVRNAGARRGVAADVAEVLSARAFSVERVAEAEAARSAVLVRNERKRYTAQELARQLGLELRNAPPGDATAADIVVVVGSDFRGLAAGAP